MRLFRVLAPFAVAVVLPLAASAADIAAEAVEAPAADTVAAPAPAPAAPQTSAHLAAAKRLYQKLDLDAAMAELREAEQDAKAKDNEEELVMVLIYKGLIYADLGKASDMSEHFKRALAMRPWTDMPPETSPRIAKQFADSRKELWGSPLKSPPKKRKSAAAPAAPPAAKETVVTPPAPVTVPAPAEDMGPPPAAPAATPAPAAKPAAKPAPAPEPSGDMEPPK